MNLEKMTALITDDDPGHIILIKKNLIKAGIKNFQTFKNGEEILLFFQNENGNNEKDYILFLDLRMPKIDGIYVLKKMKNDPLLRRIPVIIISTTEDSEEINNCRKNGCDYYLPKPIELPEIEKALTDLNII